MEDSVALLARRLGWEPGRAIPHDNRTANRLTARDLDPATRAALNRVTALDAALYRFGVELFERRFRTAVPPEDGVLPPLPDGTDFTFDRPVHGWGWHTREQHGPTWFCWTGPEAVLDVRVAARPVTFRCDVLHAIRPAALEGARVSVNGHVLDLRCRTEGNAVVLEGPVPAAAVGPRGGTVRVGFRTGTAARPCDLTPGSGDRRLLGLGVGRVCLAA
jgi:hypothetical protein